MTDVNGGNVAVIVYREDEAWDTEVLPVRLTEDLAGLVHALRQQPSIGGTIGLVAVGDDFFVALRLLGGQVSVFLSDLTAAVDWPLARQVLDYLDIPVPDDEDLDQVLPVGDMSIFADLGLDDTLPRASQHPGNAWSLHGYHECLVRLGKTEQARIIRQQLDLAAAQADVPINASCACRLGAMPRI